MTRFSFSIEIPKPRLKLKNWPAKHPVIAILANPLLATEAFVIVSPTELPHARIVRPKYDVGILNISPISPNTSMRILEIQFTQKIAIKNPHRAKSNINLGGLLLGVVK